MKHIEKRIGINTDTLELSGELKGHSLTYKCNEHKDKLDVIFDEDVDLWYYKSNMPLCGTSGYAIVKGEYVIDYKPICIH